MILEITLSFLSLWLMISSRGHVVIRKEDDHLEEQALSLSLSFEVNLLFLN